MPTRSQCSACALIERVSASLALRRLSCIRSEILTIPMVQPLGFLYVPYTDRISAGQGSQERPAGSGTQYLQWPHGEIERGRRPRAAYDLHHAVAVHPAG